MDKIRSKIQFNQSSVRRLLAFFLYSTLFHYYPLSVYLSFHFSVIVFLVLLIPFLYLILTFKGDTSLPNRLSRIKKGNQFLILFVGTLYVEVVFFLLFFASEGFLISRAIIIHFLLIFFLESILFWNGMIRVYLFSVQLGVKWRIIGLVCGWIPLLNLLALFKIIRITKEELDTESIKYHLQGNRSGLDHCKTKYPVLLVHGVFFRDSSLFNYWGRIPSYLEENGADIYYGNHESAASIEDSGKELAERIKDVLRKTKAEKVNIIAHSKGGLDCRYAIAKTDAKDKVASLTSVNTPHQGCIFADYLLDKISCKIQATVASNYNKAAKKLGDENPDFMKAVSSLTSSSCQIFNQEIKDSEDVFYQSIGSKMNRASSGTFPLNLVYPLVKHFDGENDGLVAVTSMKWGSRFQFVNTKKGRGISHADIIDLTRENIKDFDVREFYVDLLKDLKERGF